MSSSQTYKTDFKKRQEKYGILGELAENAFLQWAEQKNIQVDRYGVNNSNIDKYWKIPMKIRKTPDFLCYGNRPFFCEAKGKGRARYTKIKQEDLETLLEWDKELDVWLFFFDSHRNQVSFTDITTIVALSKDSRVEIFDGKKPYYRIADSALTWEPITIIKKEQCIGY